MAVTVTPPAPMPCSPRAAISQAMLCAAPLSADPATNTIVAIWKTSLRPNRSPSLPTTTTVTVWARRYEVTTQA